MKKLALLALLAAAAACSKHQPAATPSLPSVPVRLETAAAEPGAGAVTAPGSVHAQREATLSSRIMGQVLSTPVKAGDTVRKGQTLLVLDDRAVQGQIAQAKGAMGQAQAALALATTNLERFKELKAKESASQLELDMATMQYEQAKGAVEQAAGAVQAASSLLDDAVVKAPFAGRVVEVMLKAGDMAAPGFPLVRIEDSSKRQLWVEVAESNLAAVRAAARAACDFPALGLAGLPCAVAEVVAASNPMSRTVTVKLDLPDRTGLSAGMFGRASFAVTGGPAAVTIPESAVVERGQLAMAFTVEDGKAVMHALRLGARSGGRVEVVSGLDAGAQVVVENAARLAHGTPVEVR
jgi:RND family efflux transporter MFP subunit